MSRTQPVLLIDSDTEIQDSTLDSRPPESSSSSASAALDGEQRGRYRRAWNLEGATSEQKAKRQKVAPGRPSVEVRKTSAGREADMTPDSERWHPEESPVAKPPAVKAKRPINLTSDDSDSDSDEESADDVVEVPAPTAKKLEREGGSRPDKSLFIAGEKKVGRFRPKAKARAVKAVGLKEASATAPRASASEKKSASAGKPSAVAPARAAGKSFSGTMKRAPVFVASACECRKVKCKRCGRCVPLHCRCKDCDCNRCTQFRVHQEKRKYIKMIEKRERESAEREQEMLFQEARKRMELRRLTSGVASERGPFWRSSDPYRRLELTSAATTKDIRDRFKELARRWHPDKCSAPEAAEAFHAIREAYDVLTRT